MAKECELLDLTISQISCTSNESSILETLNSISDSTLDRTLDSLLNVSKEWEETISSQPDRTNVPILQTLNCNIQGKAVPSDARLQNCIYNVLMKYPEGELHIHFFDYEKNKENYSKLVENGGKAYFSASVVAKNIILHEVRRTGSWSIRPERLHFLAESCAQLFTGLLKEGFYRGSSSNHSATGALQHQYEYLREKASKTELFVPKKALKRKKPAEKPYSEDFETLQEVVEDIDDNYITKWKSTAVLERKQFYEKSKVNEIFSFLPNLTHPSGYILVQEDFSLFFGKPSDQFEKDWPSIAPKIVRLAEVKAKRDPLIKEILNEHQQNLKPEYNQELALLLLPYLFKKIAKATHTGSIKKNWYPEKIEVAKTFIVYIKNTQNIELLLEAEQMRLKQFHLDHKLILQPYVAISGESLSTITSSYVVVGNYKYLVDSPTQAVAVCLEFVKVFHTEFSHVSKHVWHFILKEMFHFEIPDLSKGVSDLIVSLNKL